MLELARYAANNTSTNLERRFDIRVHSTSAAERERRFHQIEPYDYWNVEQLLIGGPGRLILTGAPGAGKSFAIRNVVNILANKLQDACLQSMLTETDSGSNSY